MSYALRHTTGFYDIAGNLWTVEIHPLNYTGASGTIAKMGATPLVFDYGKSTTYPHKETMFDSRATFSLQSTSLLQLSYLFAQDKKRNKVIIKLNGNIYWTGFVVGDTYYEPYKLPPFFVDVSATDGLMLLKDRKWTEIERVSPLYVIVKCLKETGLELNIRVSIATQLIEPATTDALVWAQYHTGWYVEEKYTYFDVLENTLKAFGAIIRQVEGRWEIVQVAELAKSSYAYKEYLAAGTLSSTGTASPVVNVSGTGINSVCLLTSSGININPAFKEFTIKHLLGLKESIINNHDFSAFTLTGLLGAATFDYWQPKGTITVGRIENKPYALVNGKQSMDAVPNASTDYIIQNYGYVAGDPAAVEKIGLRLNMEFAVIKNVITSAGQLKVVTGDVYIKIKIGNWVLADEIRNEQRVGVWYNRNTYGEKYIKIADSIAAQEPANLQWNKYELFIYTGSWLQGMAEITLYATINNDGEDATVQIKGNAFNNVTLVPVSETYSQLDEDFQIDTEVNPNSNYTPATIDVALGDAPDYLFSDLIARNILKNIADNPTRKWSYTNAEGITTEDKLLVVLAAQINELFKQNRLTLQANMVSDILRFNTLVTDTARLGTRIFMMLRAQFDAQRLAWTSTELLEIGGAERIPDFDKPDYEDFDFFTE